MEASEDIATESHDQEVSMTTAQLCDQQPEDTGISPVLLQAISTIQSPANTSLSYVTNEAEIEEQALEEEVVQAPDTSNEQVVITSQNYPLQAKDSYIVKDSYVVTNAVDPGVVMVTEQCISNEGEPVVIVTKEQEASEIEDKVTIIKVQHNDGTVSQLHVPDTENVANILAALQQNIASQNRDSSEEVVIYTNSDGQQEQVIIQQAQSNEITVASTETVGEDINSEADMHNAQASNMPEMYQNESSKMDSSILDAAQQELAALRAEEQTFEACPICGDRVSGYHYGIATCESCKGFFKRTVQNKKSFSCHRGKECIINIATRKKCPACRFLKCVDTGMKLEAIREDRTRGGRSPYYGNRVRTPIRSPMPLDPNSPADCNPRLLAMLNKPFKTKPVIPSLLTDLMSLESLFNTDEPIQPKCCEEALAVEDDQQIKSLLHLADHRLYKVVRWSRNLPGFNDISLEDQILLLQNCWCHLLVIYTCSQSINNPGEIRVSYDKPLSIEKAEEFGFKGILDTMLHLIEQFRRLKIDSYEFAALKVLILINPDAKDLSNTHRVRQLQETYSEALNLYTTSHYPHLANKFGDMLLRLTEVEKIAVMGRDQIVEKYTKGNIQTTGLVSEMIKGDQERTRINLQETS